MNRSKKTKKIQQLIKKKQRISCFSKTMIRGKGLEATAGEKS